MAEDNGNASEGQDKPKKKWLKWTIILGIGIVLISSGIAGWVIFKGSGGDATAPAGKTVGGETNQDPNVVIDPFPEIMKMEPFKAELKTPWGKKKLKVKFALELFDPSDMEPLEAGLPKIRKLIQAQINTKHIKELLKMEGKLLLKNELLIKINKLFSKPKVRKLYITDFIIK